MAKTRKWKIFGYQTKVEWYDVKTKFKQLLRKFLYSAFMQELICLLIGGYMKLVFLTSEVKFINHQILLNAAKDKKPLIISFWHNRLMMIPFITLEPKKLYPYYNFMTLASKHGDGQFVGRTMERFGLISILGSTKDKRKASRGISFSSLKQIIEGLKQGYSLGITPDGPRGPNQKINGDPISIAKLSGAAIMPTSYSCSKFAQLNTWDQFKIPFPFAKICFYFDEKLIYVEKTADEEVIESLKNQLEKRMNFIQEKCDKMVKANEII
jgi:lysophospholipid acyltransferase (LPLAT)-like uncharacterized protein